MNLEEARLLVPTKAPRDWSREEEAEFLDAVSGLSLVSEDDDEFGDEQFHVARAFVDFKYFVSNVMDYGWKLSRNPATGVEQYYGFIFGDPEWPGHDQMADFLLAGHERTQILAPRGSYKTTLLQLYCIWLIGKNPNIRIMYAMDVLKNAKKCIASMMLEMERDCYIEIFGRMRSTIRAPGWAVTGLRVAQCVRTSKEPTITPGGVDSAITGDHQDIIVMDDPVSETNTRSRDMMIKTYDWTKNLEPILDPGCRLIDNGTRWHDADAHGMLMKENDEIVDEKLEWKQLLLSAERADRSPYFKHLDERKLRAARAKGTYFYSCQYLNKPVSTEDQFFFKQQFKLIVQRDVPNTVFRYLLMDSATTNSKRASRTSLWCIAVDVIENVYCLDLKVGTWKPDKVLSELYSMWMRWDPRWTTMESNVHGKVFRSYIETENRIRQMKLQVREIYGRTDGSKESRIIALQPLFQSGRIYFADSIPWDMIHEDGGEAAGEIVDEFTTFPKGFRDDIPDALADVIASDKHGRVCPPYKLRPGQQVAISHTVELSKINGRYPSDVHRRAAVQESRFVGRPEGKGGRYRGRPTGSRR